MFHPTVDSEGSAGSLGGLRVVDMTGNIAGPFATQILGDLGADVIKIERSRGDDCRGWGPPFWSDPQLSVAFAAFNRNKRSIVLDLLDEGDRGIFERLTVDADVLVQSMRPQALAGLGYSWDRLSSMNPRLIYCDVSGFGHQGPRSGQPAYDPLIQAFSGLMSITGEQGRPPVRIPVSLLDQGTGMWAVIAILDALRKREQTGSGSHLGVSLLETAIAWQPFQILGYLCTGVPPKRYGSATSNIAPYQAFPTQDGFIVVAAGNQRLWEQLCKLLDRPDLIADYRYIDNARRVAHVEELASELSEVFRTAPTDKWLSALERAGVPSSAIQDAPQVVGDEQVQATGMIRDDGDGPAMLHTPITVNGERYRVRLPAPGLGDHRQQVLTELVSPPE